MSEKTLDILFHQIDFIIRNSKETDKIITICQTNTFNLVFVTFI